MTLLGLTLAVGIVIDDAIVVLENIYRYLEEKHYDVKTASIEATKEITLAVVATTLSLVIIFVPIAFMTGYARRYVNQFGWTMAFSVMVSMLVAFTLTPMLSSIMLKRIDRKRGKDGEEAAEEHTSRDSGVFGRMAKTYGRLLAWSLDHRAIVGIVSLAIFASVIPLNSVGRPRLYSRRRSKRIYALHEPAGWYVASVNGKAGDGDQRQNRENTGRPVREPLRSRGCFQPQSHIHSPR